MPSLFGGGEFDGAHDIAILLYRLAVSGDPALMIPVLLTVLAVVAAMIVQRGRLLRLVRRVVTEPTFLLLGVSAAALSVAIVLDVVDRLRPVEELAEATAALALFAAALTMANLSVRAWMTECHDELAALLGRAGRAAQPRGSPAGDALAGRQPHLSDG